MTPGQRGFMVYFAFKLGARRALDFASFFRGRNESLSRLKTRQAGIFGQCQMEAVDRKWKVLSRSLRELADVEEELRSSLLEPI